MVDRLGFRFPFIHEVAKNLSQRGVYVLNNPFSSGAANKLVESGICDTLGLPVPHTILLPRLDGYEETEGAVTALDWEAVASKVSFPCVVKPHDGFAWEDVSTAADMTELREIYSRLGHRRILMAQAQVQYTEYYRAFCIGQKETRFMRWTPRPLGMGEYHEGEGSLRGELKARLEALTARLNQALDFDINAVEWCLDGDGRPWMIDAFNEVPEVPRDRMPPALYQWVVSSFADCILQRTRSREQNRSPFVTPFGKSITGEEASGKEAS